MKKWFLAMIFVFPLTLTACSDTASQSEDTSVIKEKTFTAEEVYTKAMQQLAALESTEFNLDMEQIVDFGENEVTTTKANVHGALTEAPFTMHQNGSVTMGSPTTGEMDINIEMYAQDGIVYVYEDLFNNWIQGTMDDLADIGLEIGEEKSPFSHVEKLKLFLDDFTFKETKDTFIFNLETNSDEFHQLILDEIQEFQVDLDESKDLTEMIDVNELHYAFLIDKETFNMLSFDIDFAIDITKDEETFAVESTIVAEFSNYNGVDEITIPQEVIERAVDRSEAFGF